jgi:hypothetical protein
VRGARDVRECDQIPCVSQACLRRKCGESAKGGTAAAGRLALGQCGSGRESECKKKSSLRVEQIDIWTIMASGRGNFIASSASIVAPEVATALKKEREEKAASASVVSIQDVEDTDDKETKAELARLRAEHNAQIATDAAQAVAQRLEFIRRHTDLLLHFSSKTPTAASKSGFTGGRKSAGRMSEKEEVWLLTICFVPDVMLTLYRMRSLCLLLKTMFQTTSNIKGFKSSLALSSMESCESTSLKV